MVTMPPHLVAALCSEGGTDEADRVDGSLDGDGGHLEALQ